VTWHTFRRTYTTLLHANGEDVKVVQELLRHGLSRITMDIYAQPQMPAKRAAQQKVVEIMRSEKSPVEGQKDGHFQSKRMACYPPEAATKSRVSSTGGRA
jgi:hypothetical protein